MKKIKEERPPEPYTLDTSAFLALWNDEDGADAVEGILRAAGEDRAVVYYSFMTAMELYYTVMRRLGKDKADELYHGLGYLPATRIEPDERLLLEAAAIKAENQLSVADAWIAATALVTGSTLVHKDPEYEALGNIIRLRRLK